MAQTIIQVDAFTSRPFAGNPAAVCVLKEPADERWMRDVAREMNLSETAFLLPQEDGYSLRWFTPAVEVDLCGHATLASAHVLWEEGHLAPSAQARFHTRSGLLTAQRAGEWIEMDFPATPGIPVAAPAGLFEALHIAPVPVYKNRFDYMLELASDEQVRALTPDFTRLMQVETRGVIVTSRSSDPQYDFISRFFCPDVGVPEDPVTGSAHCTLAPYWSGKLGRAELTGYQASARGGVVRTRFTGERVQLGGQAVTVLRGELI